MAVCRLCKKQQRQQIWRLASLPPQWGTRKKWSNINRTTSSDHLLKTNSSRPSPWAIMCIASIKRYDTLWIFGGGGMLYGFLLIITNYAFIQISSTWFFENGAAIGWAKSTPAWPQGSRFGLLEGRTRPLLSLEMAGCQLVGSPLQWCATVLKERKKTQVRNRLRKALLR